MSQLTPEQRFSTISNILQIEESYRDVIVKAEQDRYSKLRDQMTKVMNYGAPPITPGAPLTGALPGKVLGTSEEP